MHAGGRFDIELPPPPQCSGCSGLCAWRRPAAGRLVALTSSRQLAVGDAVVVRLPEHLLFAGSLLLYGLPLAALISGAAVGAAVVGTDVGAGIGAVAAAVAAWLATPRLRRRLEQRTLQRLEILPEPCDAVTRSI